MPKGTSRAISPALGFGNKELNVLGRHGELQHGEEVGSTDGKLELSALSIRRGH